MAQPIKKRATYEDLLQVPDTLVAQIIDGELITQPRPALRHASVAGRLMIVVGGAFGEDGGGGPGGWIILFEPELHFGGDIVVPDLAGWRRERVPEVPDAPWVSLAPDWVCEILSPSTASVDRTRKLDIYGREGVGHVWLVDPAARTLEVLRRMDDGKWKRLAAHAEQDEARAEPFEAMELKLARLWR